MINFDRCNSNNNDFRSLIQQLDSDLDSRYGEVQKQYNTHNQIDFIDTVIVAIENQIPVGCGCFKKFDNNTVEIKRMFVKSDYRGKGIASRILSELEHWAKELGYEQSILETGIKQVEAIGLYQKTGYQIIPNYGQYIGNNNSVCMKKVIDLNE
jgi:putative acetyltransferase